MCDFHLRSMRQQWISRRASDIAFQRKQEDMNFICEMNTKEIFLINTISRIGCALLLYYGGFKFLDCKNPGTRLMLACSTVIRKIFGNLSLFLRYLHDASII